MVFPFHVILSCHYFLPQAFHMSWTGEQSKEVTRNASNQSRSIFLLTPEKISLWPTFVSDFVATVGPCLNSGNAHLSFGHGCSQNIF